MKVICVRKRTGITVGKLYDGEPADETGWIEIINDFGEDDFYMDDELWTMDKWRASAINRLMLTWGGILPVDD